MYVDWRIESALMWRLIAGVGFGLLGLVGLAATGLGGWVLCYIAEISLAWGLAQPPWLGASLFLIFLLEMVMVLCVVGAVFVAALMCFVGMVLKFENIKKGAEQ